MLRVNNLGKRDSSRQSRRRADSIIRVSAYFMILLSIQGLSPSVAHSDAPKNKRSADGKHIIQLAEDFTGVWDYTTKGVTTRGTETLVAGVLFVHRKISDTMYIGHLYSNADEGADTAIQECVLHTADEKVSLDCKVLNSKLGNWQSDRFVLSKKDSSLEGNVRDAGAGSGAAKFVRWRP